MKFALSLAASAALFSFASADICTSRFGFQYWCPNGDGTGSTPSEPADPEPTGGNGGGNGGGSSTGGSSSYSRGGTANDITSNTGCTPLTVIFARGTVSMPILHL